MVDSHSGRRRRLDESSAQQSKGDPSFVHLAFGGDFLSKKPTNPLERRRIVRWYALRRDLTRRLTLRSKTVAGTPQRISGAWIAGGILREAQGTP